MAHAYHEVTVAYFCEGCDLVFKGRPKELDGYEFAGFVLARDIEDYRVTRYECHDDPPCQIQEDNWEELNRIWICGDCGTWYAQQKEAVDCCT